MSSFQLTCNFHNCFKEINNKGWVTSCSHIFCENHGSLLKQRGNQCPACKTKLNKTFSVLETKLLNPSNEYKTVLLMGVKPADILEIALNAINFWTYQMSEENRILKKKMYYYREQLNNVEKLIAEKIKTFNQKIEELNGQLEKEKVENRKLNMDLLKLKQKSSDGPEKYFCDFDNEFDMFA